jgi:hypothetical protein
VFDENKVEEGEEIVNTGNTIYFIYIIIEREKRIQEKK